MQLNGHQFDDAKQHQDLLDQIHERSGVRFSGRHIELPGGHKFLVVNPHVETIANKSWPDPFIMAKADIPSETGRLHRVKVFVAGRRIDEHGNTNPRGVHKINVWGGVENNMDEEGHMISKELLHSNDASMSGDEKRGPFDPHERHQIRAVDSLEELGGRLTEGMEEHRGSGAVPVHPKQLAHNQMLLKYSAKNNKNGEITFSDADGNARSLYDPLNRTAKMDARQQNKSPKYD